MKNREKTINLLKTARGQIDGIIKMMEDDRYCIDITNQLLSVEAILKKARQEILSNHLFSCILTAQNQAELEEKLEELSKVIKKLD